MTDVNKYFENMEDEERRSHPFGVTNVLMNGLNGRKSKTNLDTGRSLTWISFFCLVVGMCAVIIYLSAQAANKAIAENCEIYKINCDPKVERSQSNGSSLPRIEDTRPSDVLSTTGSGIVTTRIKRRRSRRFLKAYSEPDHR